MTDAAAAERPPPARAAATATLGWLLHAALAGVLLATLLSVVPRFERMFEDFNTVLPTSTVVAVKFSRVAVSGAFFVIPGAILALVVDWVVLFLLHKRGMPLAAAIWAAFWGLLLLAAASTIAAGVILPMVNLMDSLA